MRQKMNDLKCQLRALWNVFLGRPTMYRIAVIDGVTFKNPDPTWLVTECTFYNDGVREENTEGNDV